MTRFNYLSDTLIVTGILNAKKEPSIFNSLSSSERKKTPQATIKICSTLVGGNVAEAFCKQGIDFNGNLEIGYKDPDAEGIEACEYVFNMVTNNSRHDFLQQINTDIVALIKSNEFWVVINELAEAILKKECKCLERNEIEQIFTKNSFQKNY